MRLQGWAALSRILRELFVPGSRPLLHPVHHRPPFDITTLCYLLATTFASARDKRNESSLIIRRDCDHCDLLNIFNRILLREKRKGQRFFRKHGRRTNSFLIYDARVRMQIEIFFALIHPYYDKIKWQRRVSVVLLFLIKTAGARLNFLCVCRASPRVMRISRRNQDARQKQSLHFKKRQ